MVELVDAADSKSAGLTPLRVQVSLPAPQDNTGSMFPGIWGRFCVQCGHRSRFESQK